MLEMEEVLEMQILINSSALQLSKLYNHTYKAYDIHGYVGDLEIYSAFSVQDYYNPMLDYYYAGRVKILEFQMATSNLGLSLFDTNNTYVEF